MMAKTTGTLVSKVSSTASSPTVHYSATYTSTRSSGTTKAVSVEVTFSGWLNSSSSKLGSGIKLTVYARINKGSWSSAVLKSTSASWSGTTKHTASIALSGDITSGSATIDFYVTRSGSTYSGSAGTLGSSSSPKSYSATLPDYSVSTYRVTYSVSGNVPSGYTAPTDSSAYTSGSTVTVKAVPSAAGYSFNGWLLNGTKTTSFTISADTTLTGVWTATQKYVYFKINGVWKRCIDLRKVNGTWKNAEPRIKVSGTWK